MSKLSSEIEKIDDSEKIEYIYSTLKNLNSLLMGGNFSIGINTNKNNNKKTPASKYRKSAVTKFNETYPDFMTPVKPSNAYQKFCKDNRPEHIKLLAEKYHKQKILCDKHGFEFECKRKKGDKDEDKIIIQFDKVIFDKNNKPISFDYKNEEDGSIKQVNIASISSVKWNEYSDEKKNKSKKEIEALTKQWKEDFAIWKKNHPDYYRIFMTNDKFKGYDPHLKDGKKKRKKNVAVSSNDEKTPVLKKKKKKKKKTTNPKVSTSDLMKNMDDDFKVESDDDDDFDV
jgi:hypothetical protein